MRKFKFISAIALASLTLFSCDNKDDDSSDASIEGLWTMHERKINNVIQPLTDCEDHQTVEFTSTQTIATSYYGANCDEVDDIETSSYSLDGEILLVSTTDGEVFQAIIKELTSSTLTFTVSESVFPIETTFKR